MKSKLIMACMAVAAFAAFVVPAVASASPVLTAPTGTAAPVGTGIVGTNTGLGNWVFKGSLGNVECETVSLTGNVTENSGTSIKGDITSASFSNAGSDCSSVLGPVKVTTNVGNGIPWCLSANSKMLADEFQVRGNSCNLASRSITFVLDFTEGPTCYYDRTAVVSGKFTTHPEDAVLSFSEVEWTLEKGENETIFKPCLKTGKLTGKATLETDTATPEPVYIS